MKNTLLALLLCAGMALAPPAFAHGGEDHHDGGHDEGHVGSTATPAPSAHDAIAALEKGYADLDKAASSGSFDAIHETVETMEPALASLSDAHKQDAAITGKHDDGVTGTVEMIRKVLHEVHEAGDAKDKAKVQAELKKLDGGIRLLKARLPADHSENATTKNLSAVAEGFATLKQGEDNAITIYLSDDSGTPLSADRLQEVHTQKVHFLVADESLSDYHHLHPVALPKPGSYSATFAPKNVDNYKLWADVTPVGGSQQFIPVTLKGAEPCASPCTEKKVAYEGAAGGLKAILSFEKPLKAGEADMGMVQITDESGKPVADLEPVMGAFAHIVGFYEDFATVAHVHPMGKEPAAESDRGGPDLVFHLEPAKSGFLKLFVQVKRGGKDIFIPLGVNIG
jgi:hypothetical protein